MTPFNELHAKLVELAALDFSGRGEAYVESNFLTPLLQCLGYEAHKDYEVRRHGDDESMFKLQYPPVEKGARPVKQYNPDYIPTIRKKVFWIIEAKSPKNVTFPFDYSFIVQGLQYCVHPEIQAKYLVISNGRYTSIYDAHGSVFLGEDIYASIVDIDNKDIISKWNDIYQLLSVETLRGQIEADLRKMYEKLCLSSLDERYPEHLMREIGKQRAEITQQIRKEVARLHAKSLQDGLDCHQADLGQQDSVQLLTMMNMPMGIGKPAGIHLVERSISEQRDLPSLFDLLTYDYERQSTFRKEHTFAALCEIFKRTELENLKNKVKAFLDANKDGTLSPLNRAECAAVRIVRKLFVIHAYEPLRSAIDASLTTAPEIIRFVRTPTALDYTLVAELMNHHAMFEQLLRLPDTELTALATALEAYEKTIDDAFRQAQLKLRPNEHQIAGFETRGAGGRLWSLRILMSNFGVEVLPLQAAPV